jgi:hypothetical protein
MAAAVFEAAADDRYAGVTITVLPGMTAAQAVAARAGAPLGGDYAVISLSDRLKPWSVIEQRLRAIAVADLVLVIYNPASRTRREQIVRARELLLELRASETPVVVGRNVGRDGEELTVTTLEELDANSIDMSCLLIIGSSQTRLGHGGTVVDKAVLTIPDDQGAQPFFESGRETTCDTPRDPLFCDHFAGLRSRLRARTPLSVQMGLTKSSACNASPTMITAACRRPARSTWSAMVARVPRRTVSFGWVAFPTTATGSPRRTRVSARHRSLGSAGSRGG